MITSFNFSGTPQICFGAGRLKELSRMVKGFGKNALIVTGAKSFISSPYWNQIGNGLCDAKIKFYHLAVSAEPSPELIDNAVGEYRSRNINCVVAIGGGSAIDTGKAISAMLMQYTTVVTFLEDVGAGVPHNGIKVPFIAIPTTSGAGSEATNNAVIGRSGKTGFKKSIRHDSFIPNIALIDPELMVNCPKNITATAGLDAFVQLLEAYMSINSTPLTDSLAYGGIEFFDKCYVPACTTHQSNVGIRSGMAYAALLSGVALANAGVGIVNSLAWNIGSYFEIPHGIICDALLASATRVIINALRTSNELEHLKAFKKYASIGALFAHEPLTDIYYSCEFLIKQIESWVHLLEIPKLGAYGLTEADIDLMIQKTAHKQTPITLSVDELKEIVRGSL